MPQPGAGEVLIRVAAAGVNRADLLQRAGHYPPPPGASPVLGLEVSGHIVEIGEGTVRWKSGDAVCALLPGGGYAEFCIAHAGSCLPVPDGISVEHAAAIPEAAFTVWTNLFSPRRIHPGDRFLIHGGSSGIGTLAIQIAKHFGARVVTTAGTAEKCRFCMELGCERAFNYRQEDWFEGIRQWSDGYGVDVVLDMVGGDYFSKHLNLLAPHGRLVQIAFSGGSEVTVDLRAMMSKRLVLTGSTLRSRPAAEKAGLRDEVEENLWPLFARGTLHPVIDSVFPLKQAAEAHRRMAASEHIGKILLSVS